MARTLFVHVGPRKTATTAIQAFLGKHDNSIVIYPKVGLHGIGSHHGLVFSFFDAARKKDDSDSIEQLFEKIGEQTRDSDLDVVISSEAMEIQNRDVGAFVRALLPYVSRTPIKVELVLAVREHFGRTASLYNHLVRARKGAVQRNLPDEFLEANAAEMCYAPYVRRLKNSGFNVTALNYHPSESWTDRFFAYIGFPADEIPKIDMRHVALSPKVLIALAATNETVRSKDNRRKFRLAFAAMPESKTPSRFIFGQEAARTAEVLFSEDRKFLFDEFGIKIVGPDVENEQNAFFLSHDEFEEIAAVARDLGPGGNKILKFAREYVRDSGR